MKIYESVNRLDIKVLYDSVTYASKSNIVLNAFLYIYDPL